MGLSDSEPAAPPAASGAEILLVDDQDRNLDALEAILDSTGFQLVRARSADEALLALLKRDFAAIVCDIKMPGVGGIELARMIKQRKRTQHIPILFLTAHSIDETDLLRGYNVGAVDYLSKPINPEILRLKLAVFVELFSKTRALAETNKALAAEVAERQRAEEELRLAKLELERRVEDRTAELVAANRALRESEDRMIFAMQSASMAVFSHNLRTDEILWSAAMEKMFGVPEGTFERTFSAFLKRIHPQDRERVAAEIASAAERRAEFSLEYRFLHSDDPDGATERWMSTVGRFVLDQQGVPIHAIGVSTNITERQLAAIELRTLKESAESANRAKDHFLAVLSHELRTPLTPALATVQDLLQSPKLDPELRDQLDLINRNIELEARLIDDLLDLTRIARGKMQIQRSVLDVNQILEHALRTCDVDFKSKGITLRIVKEATATLIDADRARLLQVFWNLLKNAAKFTPPGKSVCVRMCNPSATQLRVEVSDTGIGIAAERLDAIFNSFEQGEAGTVREYGGLGLGLSIGKALVELHGGQIRAHSAGLGQGATFIVDLPLAGRVAEPSTETAAKEGGSRHVKRRSHPPRRLLLVEDHPDTAQVMKRLLNRAGFEVTSAATVGSAIQACDSSPDGFDLVISDIGLPDGSGLDLMRYIRSHFPGTPGVAVSGFGMEEDRARSLAAGFAAHVTKPVDVSLLERTIDRLTV